MRDEHENPTFVLCVRFPNADACRVGFFWTEKRKNLTNMLGCC